MHAKPRSSYFGEETISFLCLDLLACQHYKAALTTMLSFHLRIMHVLLLIILAICRQTSGFTSPNRPPSATTSQRYRTYVQVPNYKLSTMISTSNDQEQEKLQYIRPYMKQLFLLCRPSNFPIVTLFHMLGVHISLKLFQESVPTSHSLFLPLLKNSSMLMVLLSLLLVTSTSMISKFICKKWCMFLSLTPFLFT